MSGEALNLQRNYLTQEGAKQFITVMQDLHILRSVDLRDNVTDASCLGVLEDGEHKPIFSIPHQLPFWPKGKPIVNLEPWHLLDEIQKKLAPDLSRRDFLAMPRHIEQKRLTASNVGTPRVASRSVYKDPTSHHGNMSSPFSQAPNCINQQLCPNPRSAPNRNWGTPDLSARNMHDCSTWCSKRMTAAMPKGLNALQILSHQQQPQSREDKDGSEKLNNLASGALEHWPYNNASSFNGNLHKPFLSHMGTPRSHTLPWSHQNLRGGQTLPMTMEPPQAHWHSLKVPILNYEDWQDNQACQFKKCTRHKMTPRRAKSRPQPHSTFPRSKQLISKRGSMSSSGTPQVTRRQHLKFLDGTESTKSRRMSRGPWSLQQSPVNSWNSGKKVLKTFQQLRDDVTDGISKASSKATMHVSSLPLGAKSNKEAEWNSFMTDMAGTLLKLKGRLLLTCMMIWGRKFNIIEFSKSGRLKGQKRKLTNDHICVGADRLDSLVLRWSEPTVAWWLSISNKVIPKLLTYYNVCSGCKLLLQWKIGGKERFV